ncbi:hypothetical protein [Catenulispora rubra]|uniref:hypothetical protein n=1 Tax=Catenulispora rubra TaxID=280293 RepID=UPI001892815A|nr:hypothetical protein [Catenulispora rubra]
MTDLIESEDELLDPPAGPAAAAPPHRLASALHRLRERTPLGAGDEIDPERRRRLGLAALLAVAIAAGAGATGVAVHSRDLDHAQTRTQDRVLLHLLGGGAGMRFGGDSVSQDIGAPGTFQTPLSADFTVAVRNDGAKPLQITAVGIAVPGVDVVDAAPATTLAPGDSESLTSRVAVHCTAADLPRYPSGVTLTVRTPAAVGKAAGAPTALPLAFDAGHPTALPVGSNGFFTEVDGFSTTTTSSFYELCGEVLTMIPPRVSATANPGDASPRNPVVGYSLHIDNSPDAAQMAVVLPKPPAVPGVSAQTDLAGPEQIGTQGLDVNVTDRITDCGAFGDYLAVRGGATQAAEALNAATPIGLQPVDPRFQTTPTPLSTTAQAVFDGVTPGTADLQSTLLTQLAAVCPML